MFYVVNIDSIKITGLDNILSCNDKEDDTGCHEQDGANQNTQTVSSKVLKEKQLNKKSMPGRTGVCMLLLVVSGYLVGLSFIVELC